MDIISRLDSQGIAIYSVLHRIGGNVQLYCRLCNKFLDDLNYPRIKDALQNQAYEDLMIYLHTLKGVSANLGFTQLEYLCKVCLIDLQNKKYTQLNLSYQSLSIEYQKLKDLIVTHVLPIINIY